MPGRLKVSRSEREDQILDVAARAFGEHGYRGASMEAIADGVGFTKPMLYRYFGSKEGLFVACALRLWREMGAAIFEAATQPGPPDVRLWRGILAYYRFVGRHRAEWRVMYPELAPGGGDAGEQLRAARAGAVTMMVGLFSSAAAETRVGPELAELAESMAYGFVGASTAIAAWWVEHPEEPAEAPALRLMNLVWAGFGNLIEGELWSAPE